MRYLDLFTGYGGFTLGIQKAYEKLCLENEKQSEVSSSGNKKGQYCKQFDNGAKGLTCIGFSEIDKYAIQTYQKHFPTHKNYGDITKINPEEFPDFDLLCGGFPCQSFSIAGKRAGFEDTRGTLIYDVFRIIEEKHPKLVLLENVKGLLSHDNGRTFKTIITSLAEFGYAVEWQVLNAKDFGVPQNRERVFIVGHFGGFRGRKIFPISGSNEQNDEKRTLAYTLNSSDWRWANRNQKQTTIRTDQQDSQERGNQPNNSNSIRRTSYSNGMRIRRLTPPECERLMGLPDGWTEGVSDTQRYKLAGNGVVVNVVEEIVKRLIKNYQ